MKNQKAFTLVELVVVILILGILAGIAAPSLIGTAANASETGLRQNLSIVRNSIELFATQNGGSLPGATFLTDVAQFMRGDFPAVPVGSNQGDANVAIGTTSVPSGTQGWRYNTTTGEFFANTAEIGSDGAAYNTY